MDAARWAVFSPAILAAIAAVTLGAAFTARGAPPIAHGTTAQSAGAAEPLNVTFANELAFEVSVLALDAVHGGLRAVSVTSLRLMEAATPEAPKARISAK